MTYVHVMRSAILREISAKALNTKEAHVASKNGLRPKKKQKDVTADDVPVVVINEEVVVTPDVSLSASSFVEESISIPEDQIVVGLIDPVDQSPQSPRRKTTVAAV